MQYNCCQTVKKTSRVNTDITSRQGDSNLIERLVKKHARRLQCTIRLIQNNSSVLSQFCGSIHIVLHLRQAYCQICFVPLSANGGTKTFFFPTNCIYSTFLNPACSTGYPAASVSDTKVRDPEIDLYKLLNEHRFLLIGNPLVRFVMAVGREYLHLSVPEPIFGAKTSSSSKTLAYLLVLDFNLPVD